MKIILFLLAHLHPKSDFTLWSYRICENEIVLNEHFLNNAHRLKTYFYFCSESESCKKKTKRPLLIWSSDNVTYHQNKLAFRFHSKYFSDIWDITCAQSKVSLRNIASNRFHLKWNRTHKCYSNHSNKIGNRLAASRYFCRKLDKPFSSSE